MKASQEDIMQGNQQHKTFLEMASGGLLYIRMIRNTTKPARYAKEWGNP